jgi:4-amino-4-deoxy-L-arabinose transferase-like glycosyltransferase
VKLARNFRIRWRDWPGWPVDLGIFAAVAVALSVGRGGLGLWPALELDALERSAGHRLFHLFGDSLSAVRSISVLATLVAAMAVFFLFARLGSIASARLAVVMIATAPAVIARARLVGSEPIATASVALTLACFAFAALGHVRSGWWRVLALAIGIAQARVFVGFTSPALIAAIAAAVGVTHLVTRESDRTSRCCAAAIALVGVVSALSFALQRPPALAVTTFDAPLARLGHEAFPFSALAPLVLAGAAHGTAARLSALVLTSLYVAELAMRLA